MIPEYKLYHGAVIAELVHELATPLLIDELKESGRLASYVLNGSVGLQIKHATQRLTPWNFAFTRQNLIDTALLLERCEKVYAVFVCETHGMVCLEMDEIRQIVGSGSSDQAWIRIDRRRGKQFCIHGAKGELPSKKPNGIDALVRFLERDQASTNSDT